MHSMVQSHGDRSTYFKMFASANKRDEMTSSLFLAPRKRLTTHGDRILPTAGDLSMRYI